MPIKSWLFTVLITLLPVFELRGAIPYAMAQGASPLLIYAVCVLTNAAVGPLVFLFLSTFHRWFAHLSWYQSFFDKLVIRARKKVKTKVDRYGYLGLALFVAIPLPITGAYTGSLGAWVLGMHRGKTFLAVTLGVLIAGVVVTLVTYLGIEALSLFVKEVHT